MTTIENSPILTPEALTHMYTIVCILLVQSSYYHNRLDDYLFTLLSFRPQLVPATQKSLVLLIWLRGQNGMHGTA